MNQQTTWSFSYCHPADAEAHHAVPLESPDSTRPSCTKRDNDKSTYKDVSKNKWARGKNWRVSSSWYQGHMHVGFFCPSSCLETCQYCCVVLWQALHPRACGRLSTALPLTELSDELLFRTAQALCCPTGAPHKAHPHLTRQRIAPA